MLDIAIGAVAQGILWGIMTLGVYLTYKVLDYSDLSVDGSLALGGAASAALIVKGIDPVEPRIRFKREGFFFAGGWVDGCSGRQCDRAATH